MTTRGSLQRGAGQQQFQGPVRKWKRDWVYLLNGSNTPAPKRLKLLKWVQLDERVPEISARRFPNLIPLEKASGPANDAPAQSCDDEPMRESHPGGKSEEPLAGVEDKQQGIPGATGSSPALQPAPNEVDFKGKETRSGSMDEVPSENLHGSGEDSLGQGEESGQVETSKGDTNSGSTPILFDGLEGGIPGISEGGIPGITDIYGDGSGDSKTDDVNRDEDNDGNEEDDLDDDVNEGVDGELFVDTEGEVVVEDDFLRDAQGLEGEGYLATISEANADEPIPREEFEMTSSDVLESEHLRTEREAVSVGKEGEEAHLRELDGGVIVHEVDGGIALQAVEGDVILQEGDEILGEVVTINNGEGNIVGTTGEGHSVDQVGYRLEGFVDGEMVGKGVEGIPMESIEFASHLEAQNIEGIEGLPHVVITTGGMGPVNVQEQAEVSEDAQAEDLIAALSGEGFDIELGGSNVAQPAAQESSQAPDIDQQTGPNLYRNKDLE